MVIARSKNNYLLRSTVITYPGMGGWRFLALPTKEAKEIKANHGTRAKGWGSLPVRVKIGKTEWNTSIFPDTKSGTYLLPLKAQIRRAEEIDDEDMVKFNLTLV